MRHLKRVLPYLIPYWPMAALSIAFTIVASLVGLLAPWPLTLLVDYVLGDKPLPGILDFVLNWLGQGRGRRDGHAGQRCGTGGKHRTGRGRGLG